VSQERNLFFFYPKFFQNTPKEGTKKKEKRLKSLLVCVRARSHLACILFLSRAHRDIMNEEEIERLARENFSRRIRAILSLREEEEREVKKRSSSTFCSTSPRRNLVTTHAERRRRRTTTTKELSSKDKQNDGNSNNDANAVAVLKARKEMARAFQSAAEMLMVKSPSGKKGRREEEEEEEEAEKEEEEERKMEEIAKRVFAENEKKTRARERLAVVEVMLDVLKDTRREVVVGSER